MGCSTFSNFTVLPETAVAKIRDDSPFQSNCYSFVWWLLLVRDVSRLSCQILLTPSLDRLAVSIVPED